MNDELRWAARAAVLVLAAAAAFAVAAAVVGCSNIKGFQYAGDGAIEPRTAREAAIVARAEADALEQIAEEQTETTRRGFSAAEDVASAIGAPEVVAGLIGAASTLFVPPPGTRRRREAGAAAAAAGRTGEDVG